MKPDSGTAGKLPLHVGIIMDGNGRWAVRRGLPRKMGHRHGAEAFRRIAKHAQKLGIAHLTVYALSTENWRRPADEIDTIIGLLRSYMKELDRYRDENVRIVFLGDPSPFDADLRDGLAGLMADTRDNTGMCLNIAVNYGGRAELLHAAKELLRHYREGRIPDIDALSEEDFASGLYTSGQPDVDLLIRTSGEQRLSNFLPWQCTYAEFAFPEVLWPDFTPAIFDKVLADYAARARRMGGI